MRQNNCQDTEHVGLAPSQGLHFQLQGEILLAVFVCQVSVSSFQVPIFSWNFVNSRGFLEKFQIVLSGSYLGSGPWEQILDIHVYCELTSTNCHNGPKMKRLETKTR